VLLVSTALAATENNTGNATIKDNYVLSTSLATTEKSTSLQTTETQIASGNAHNPAIYVDKIVWADYSNGSKIYMYDISTKKETQISSNASNVVDPAIYGDKIVWAESNYDELFPYEIHMYDLSTSKDSVISDTYSNYVQTPAIYSNKVVWNDYLDDSSEICVYDLSTKEETTIAYNAYSPAIYGKRIVYVGNNYNEGKNIYMYDISTQKETKITNSGLASDPAIYGNKIVWDDYHNGNTDIYMYDLSTKKQTRITSSPDAQTHPAIYGDKIVWEDDGGEDDGWVNHGIYMYDISTKQKMKISAKESAYYPAIYGNNIVWQYGYSDPYGYGDIYVATVPQPKSPVAAFSASPRSGKAPLKVKFTDKSANSPTSWKWSFGDKTYSTTKNPVHKYSKTGKYTVSLTVKNAKGSNTKTTSGYIVAKK
jgi:beta propeller repeat protein